MNNIRLTIYNNFKHLYHKYLPIYGVDKYNIKKDLILLTFIDEILYNECFYGVMNECRYNRVLEFTNHILRSNPKLGYCRVDIDCNYNNLGDPQNIRKYQVIDCEPYSGDIPEDEYIFTINDKESEEYNFPMIGGIDDGIIISTVNGSQQR